MKKLQILSLATITVAACSPQEGAQPPEESRTAIYCGALIDGIGDNPLSDRTIHVAGDRIESVSTGRPAGNHIDLSQFTCLPGLIDTHTHITDLESDYANLANYFEHTLDSTLATARMNSEITLGAGFTTVRNLGAYFGWAGRETRDRIERGDFPGPRILAAGYYLTIPGGGGDMLLPDFDENEIPAHVRLGVARGPDAFRARAAQAVAGGADLIKVIASGAVLSFGEIPGRPEMTEEEIRAAAEVAHEAGILLTAHAHSAQSIKDAIRAGANSIEHASLADDEAIEMAAANDVAFSMDIYNGEHIATVGRAEGWPQEFLDKNDVTTEAQRDVFRRALAAGVPITFGTDAGTFPHGDNARMFSSFVENGMTPMQAILSATSIAARYIGRDRDVGAIEHGRYADIIAVRGNPLDDISILENVEVVIKGGERFK